MLGENVQRTYFNVSLGKLRIKCDATNPKAISRVDSENKTVHELVYNFAEGTLEDVKFKQDDEYGNKWYVYVKDGGDNYVLQMNENSRYCQDFLCKLPRLKKGCIYKFTPWEMEKDGKRKAGVSIKNDADFKIVSFYHKYPEGVNNAKPEYVHDFPVFEGEWKDKDEVKIYFLKVTKFLRQRSLEYIATNFREPENHSVTVPGKEDDLPF